MADRTVIEQIKESLDIASVVREYVSLRKSGSNEFGLCPFHHEKSPSFSVNSDLKIFKCFGCGESGDVITFLQKVEGLDFAEALKLAADKAGIAIKNDFVPHDNALESKKKKILEINTLAAKFFNYVLLKHEAGKKALDYLNNRKLGRTAIDMFLLGYAPNQWSALIDFMKKRGYKLADLLEAGLVVERNGKTYDKFRGRVIFPLFNEKGQIIGFAGRIIEKDSKAPKYLNSPETLVFNKSRFLFGLYQGKKEIRSKGYAIIVEGPTDVINSNQNGLTNICAPQGTSLTAMQLKLLHRYADTVYYCFDQDDAGQLALKRALDLAWDEGLSVKVINLEGVKDADELMQKNFKEWEKSVSNAMNVVDYFLLKAITKYNVKTVEGKVNVVNDLIPIITGLKNEVEKEGYINELSARLELDVSVIKSEMKSSIHNTELAKQNLREKIKEEMSKSSMQDSEEYLLALMVQGKEISFKDVKPIEDDLFTDEILRQSFSFIRDMKRKKKDLQDVISQIEDDDVKDKILDLMMIRLGEKVEDESWVKEEFSSIWKRLEKVSFQRDLNRLQIELKAAESAGDEKLAEKLESQIGKFAMKLAGLK